MTRKIAGVTVVTLGIAVLVWWYLKTPSAEFRSALSAREIATRVMAEYLVHQYPGSNALVVGNPFTQRSGQSPEIYAFESASMRGLEEGFGSKERLRLVHPELRPEFQEHP